MLHDLKLHSSRLSYALDLLYSFVLFWPHLLVLPPLSLSFYTSHIYWVLAFLDLARNAKETLKGFVTGWLIELLKEVLMLSPISYE